LQYRYDDLKAGLAYTISEIPWICGEVVSIGVSLIMDPAICLPYELLLADTVLTLLQGLEEGSNPQNNRIQIVDGLGGVQLKYVT
jgi:hypothetical protein